MATRDTARSVSPVATVMGSEECPRKMTSDPIYSMSMRSSSSGERTGDETRARARMVLPLYCWSLLAEPLVNASKAPGRASTPYAPPFCCRTAPRTRSSTWRVSWPALVTAARNRSASKRASGLSVMSAVSSSSVTRTLETPSIFRSDRSSPAAHRLQVSPFTTILTSSICADATAGTARTPTVMATSAESSRPILPAYFSLSTSYLLLRELEPLGTRVLVQLVVRGCRTAVPARVRPRLGECNRVVDGDHVLEDVRLDQADALDDPHLVAVR